MEILRKIEFLKNQKLLSNDYLYNFVIKFFKTNIKKCIIMTFANPLYYKETVIFVGLGW